jgi:epsin
MVRGAAGSESGVEDFAMGIGGHEENSPRRGQQNGRGGAGGKPRRDEDGDLRQAIEESKKSLALEQQAAEERELQEAIQLSKQEEDARKHAVEDSNASSLFDDQQQLYVSLFLLFILSLADSRYRAGRHRRTRTATTPSHS